MSHKGPSGASVTYCNISCFLFFLAYTLAKLYEVEGDISQLARSGSIYTFDMKEVNMILHSSNYSPISMAQTPLGP